MCTMPVHESSCICECHCQCHPFSPPTADIWCIVIWRLGIVSSTRISSSNWETSDSASPNSPLRRRRRRRRRRVNSALLLFLLLSPFITIICLVRVQSIMICCKRNVTNSLLSYSLHSFNTLWSKMGKKHRQNSHLIIHCPTSEGVS